MKYLTLSIIFIIGGCATSKFNSQPMIVEASFPNLNEVSTVSVGDTLLEQGKKTKVQIWTVEQPFRVSITPIGKGEFIKVGEDDEYYYVRHSEAVNFNTVDSVRLTKGSRQVCYIGTNHVAYCGTAPENQRMDLEDKYILSKNSFQRSLIYNGKIGDKINVAYREFSNDLARPAFNNNVEYDLKESKTIAYKGAVIEVLDANNQIIKYRVLKNFNTVSN
ncbi:hypothetical protein G9F31_15020 [Acinetobacter sp. 187]|jgi:hypothetical protein|uniref:hypothetical protein n=1 Tax=Acinetobacter lanii TaxID=2715163 RepID=UPI00140CD380|nr:hypothetical protein [Acinetobacter lanii]NHC05048.1 hypothetical protein [Acinetobacter lanii]